MNTAPTYRGMKELVIRQDWTISVPGTKGILAKCQVNTSVMYQQKNLVINKSSCTYSQSFLMTWRSTLRCRSMSQGRMETKSIRELYSSDYMGLCADRKFVGRSILNILGFIGSNSYWIISVAFLLPFTLLPQYIHSGTNFLVS